MLKEPVIIEGLEKHCRYSIVPNTENVNEDKESVKRKWGYRHIVALIAFMSFMQVNIQRISSTLAIVAMVNTTEHPSNTTLESSCPLPQNMTHGVSERKYGGEFNWSSDLYGYVSGAGFFGMFVGFLPGGRLTQLQPSKRLIVWAGIASSAAVALAPLLARTHVYAFIAAMFVRGCGESINSIAFSVISANWFPREENGILSTFCISGYSSGAILSAIVSGWICENPLLGWPVVFYIVAGTGTLLALLVLLLLYETPSEHPKISLEEINYIVDKKQISKKTEPTPWLKIMSSVSTYALLVAFFGAFWTYSYFWSVNTTFLGTVLHVPIKKNGLYSALPYLFKIFGENSASCISHWLLLKRHLSIDCLRKSCTFLGYSGFSAAVAGIYFSGCDGFASATFSSVAMFFVGVSTPGAQIAYLDMTKKFTGPFSGIMNIAGSSAAFLFPIVVGYLTPHKTLTEWHSVFFLTICVVMGSGIAFVVFGSAEIQPWNFDETDKGPLENDNHHDQKKNLELTKF